MIFILFFVIQTVTIADDKGIIVSIANSQNEKMFEFKTLLDNLDQLISEKGFPDEQKEFNSWVNDEIERIMLVNDEITQKRVLELNFLSSYMKYRDGQVNFYDFYRSLKLDKKDLKYIENLSMSGIFNLTHFYLERSPGAVRKKLSSAINSLSQDFFETCAFFTDRPVENSTLAITEMINSSLGFVSRTIVGGKSLIAGDSELHVPNAEELLVTYRNNHKIRYALEFYIAVRNGEKPPAPDASLIVSGFVQLAGLGHIPSFLAFRARDLKSLIDIPDEKFSNTDVMRIIKEGDLLENALDVNNLDNETMDMVKKLITKVKRYVKLEKSRGNSDTKNLQNARKALNFLKLIKYKNASRELISLHKRGKKNKVMNQIANELKNGERNGAGINFLLYEREMAKKIEGYYNEVEDSHSTYHEDLLREVEESFNQLLHPSVPPLPLNRDELYQNISSFIKVSDSSKVKVSSQNEEEYLALIRKGETKFLKPALSNVEGIPSDVDYQTGNPEIDKIESPYKHAINIMSLPENKEKMDALLEGDISKLEGLSDEEMKTLYLTSIMALKGLEQLPDTPGEKGVKYTYKVSTDLIPQTGNNLSSRTYDHLLERYNLEKPPVVLRYERSPATIGGNNIIFQTTRPLEKKIYKLSQTNEVLFRPPLTGRKIKSLFEIQSNRGNQLNVILENQ